MRAATAINRVVPVASALLLPLALTACTPRVRVDPIEVKPIHIVHDINIRVDRELDQFFAFQDQPTTQQATTAPTTQTASAAAGEHS